MDGPPHALLALTLLELSERNAPGVAFEDDRQSQHDVVPYGVFEGVWVTEVRDTLVHRHTAAHGEDENGNDECPEVELLAISEGMAGVGRAPAHADA
jgi:hypothetical protein